MEKGVDFVPLEEDMMMDLKMKLVLNEVWDFAFKVA